MALSHRKNGVELLPVQERHVEVAKKISARGLQYIEVTRVIDVVTGGTLGISDAMRGLKSRHLQEQLQPGWASKVKKELQTLRICWSKSEKSVIPDSNH
jgi:hypothetical protein